MASGLYASGAGKLISGVIDLDTDDIRPTLVDTGTYTVNYATHDFYDDVSGVVADGGAAIASPTVTGGVYDGTDYTFTSVSGASIEMIVLSEYNATPSSRALLAAITVNRRLAEERSLAENCSNSVKAEMLIPTQAQRWEGRETGWAALQFAGEGTVQAIGNRTYGMFRTSTTPNGNNIDVVWDSGQLGLAEERSLAENQPNSGKAEMPILSQALRSKTSLTVH